MSNRTVKALGIVVAVLVVFGVGVLMMAAKVVDMQGRQANQHFGAVPSGVTQLTPRAYLVDNHSGAAPSALCGKREQSPAVRWTQAIPRLGAVYVECGHGQDWNDHRPRSLSYSQAIVKLATAPASWIGFGGFAILMMLPILGRGLGDLVYARRTRRQAVIDDETKRRDLTAAWARGEITDLEFENSLDKILGRKS